MAIGKIHNMNVISYSCTIMSWIVITKYSKLCSLSDCYLCNIWHKVVWNTVRILTYSARYMSTHRIKITKYNSIPLLISFLHVHQHLLKHAFSPAIRISANAFRTVFSNWNFYRITINCSTTTEDDILATVRSHYLNEYKSSGNVVIIVLKWLLYTFTNCFKSSKVNTCIKLMLCKYIFKSRLISNVYLIERNLIYSYYLGYSSKRFRITVAQVVHYHSCMTCSI